MKIDEVSRMEPRATSGPGTSRDAAPCCARRNSRRARWALLGCLCIVLVSFLAGCALTAADEGDDVSPSDGDQSVFSGGDDVPSPDGDQSVFSGIDVLVQVSEFDSLDHTDGLRPAPVRLGQGVHVVVNGGTSEGRVPGLQVFANGNEVAEVGSAGLPQQFSYQYYAGADEDDAQPVRGQGTLLEFRLMDASFHMRVEPPTGEILSPGPDDVLPVSEPLVVRWTGESGVPSVEIAHLLASTGAHCAFRFTRGEMHDDHVAFAAESADDDWPRDEPPCVGDVRATWAQPEVAIEPATPLNSFRVTGTLSRLQRFVVQ